MASELRVSDDLWHEVDLIEGWLWRDEADLLYRLNNGVWCEVGCWKGKSTRVLAESGPGFAVDWFKGSPEHDDGTDTFDEFMANVGWHPNVRTIRGRFEAAAGHVGPVSLLHLDADHSYEATALAFALYALKVKAGGHVVFHDAVAAHWGGVERFVSELKYRPGWAHVEDVGRSAVFRRA